MIYSNPRIKKIAITTLLFVFVLLHGTGLFQYIDTQLSGDWTEASPALKAFINSITAIILLLALRNFNKMLHFFKSSIFGELLLVVSIYVLLSSLWSSSIPTGLNASLKLIIPMLLTILVCLRSKSYKTLQYCMVLFFGFIAVANIYFGALIPEMGRHQFEDESWKGVFGNRNEACLFTNLALCYFIFSFRYTRKHRIVNLLLAASCVFFVFMSNSGTGRISSIIILVLAAVLPFASSNKRTFIPMVIFAGMFFISSIGVASVYQEDLLRMLNKDSGLTGRVDLWKNIAEAVKEKPVFGYGSEPVVISRITGKLIPSSSEERKYGLATHNTYLTYLLNFGLVGFVLMITLHAITFMGLIKNLYSKADKWQFINFSFFITISISQLTIEFFQFMTFWVFFTYLYIAATASKSAPFIEA